MKKIFLTLCLALSVASAAWAGSPAGKLRSLVSSYRSEPGFEVVDLGGLGMSLLKAAARSGADAEDREALEMLKGIKRMTILDFSDAAADKKEKFLRKARRILSEDDLLMEAKDEEETVRIYGLSSKDGSILEDIILFTDDALISIRGKIRADQVGELIATAESR